MSGMHCRIVVYTNTYYRANFNFFGTMYIQDTHKLLSTQRLGLHIWLGLTILDRFILLYDLVKGTPLTSQSIILLTKNYGQLEACWVVDSLCTQHFWTSLTACCLIQHLLHVYRQCNSLQARQYKTALCEHPSCIPVDITCNFDLA